MNRDSHKFLKIYFNVVKKIDEYLNPWAVEIRPAAHSTKMSESKIYQVQKYNKTPDSNGN